MKRFGSSARVPHPAKADSGSTLFPLTGAWTVSQVTALVKRAIEAALPPTLHVMGEISNFKRHASGHVYFTLKDVFSELSCVMWRSDGERLRFRPNDGLQVTASGSIDVFGRSGRYQLYVRKLEPRGVGALQLAFRQLCEKLAKEGLFDESRKRPLPRFPARIAIVTSPTGAVIADMLRTIQRRFPCVHVLFHSVRVQGPGAAEEIAAALGRINESHERLGGIDLVIVGRGGGSLEDLWAFNEEVVARAIFVSRIPIISAVGHEMDVTIADLVADVRAATPTAAAELAVPVLEEVLADLRARQGRLARAVRGRAQLLQVRLAALAQRGPFRDPLSVLYRREQILDELVNRLHRNVIARFGRLRRRLDELEPVIRRILPNHFLLECTNRLHGAQACLHRAQSRRGSLAERWLTLGIRRLDRFSPNRLLQQQKVRLGRFHETLPRTIRQRLALCGEQTNGLERRLAALSYKSVLQRGFSITRTKRARRVLRSLAQVKDHDRIVTELADGQFESEVVNLHQLDLFE